MKKLFFSLIVFMLFNFFAKAQISITYIPEWGNTVMNLKGKVVAKPDSFKIATLIFVQEAGGWWTKPYLTTPTVPINSDSTFTVGIVTGGSDQYATRIIVFLVPITVTVPLLTGNNIPDSFLSKYPYDIVSRPHGDNIIKWSNYNWTALRSFNNLAFGPGPNIFSSTSNSVWKDSNDYLHLTISKPGNDWLCTEVQADTALGYGKYTFILKSEVDNLDIQSVLGLFTWDDLSQFSKTYPDSFYRELDIEYSYWVNPLNNIGQFVVQPYNINGNIHRFPMSNDSNTIQTIEWMKDTILFSTYKSDLSLINSFVYTGKKIKPEDAKVHLNMWLDNGVSPNKGNEIIIKKFVFNYMLDAPKNLSASDNTHEDTVIVIWDKVKGAKYYALYRNTVKDSLNAQIITTKWIDTNYFEDITAMPGQEYYYWVRASDNNKGSNFEGYTSGWSANDTGRAKSKISIIKQTSKQDDNFEIIPNPVVNGYAEIKLSPNSFDKFYNIKIIDILGNTVSEMNLPETKTLDLRQFNKGLYIVILESNEGKWFRKVIVQ